MNLRELLNSLDKKKIQCLALIGESIDGKKTYQGYLYKENKKETTIGLRSKEGERILIDVLKGKATIKYEYINKSRTKVKGTTVAIIDQDKIDVYLQDIDTTDVDKLQYESKSPEADSIMLPVPIHSDEKLSDVLQKLLLHVESKSPREAGNLKDDEATTEKVLVVVTVEHVLSIAAKNNWAMARYQDSYYLFTGSYWQKLSQDELKNFLGKAAERINVDRFQARHYIFKDNLVKQFYSAAFFKPPALDSKETKINLANGTYVVGKNKQYLKPFDKDDFQLYRLEFPYDEKAKADRFQQYLDRVIPDIKKQQVLAEFLGYVFIKNSVLKLEKALILFGSGGNGKSVLFDIILKLLGPENISNFSLQNLTDEKGYTRAMLSGKLLNYASEISTRLNPTIFKILVSGEPIEARMIYGKPFLLKDYARMIFNTNVLPKDIESNPGFFRRFMIINFDQTISDEEKDPGLANHIIANELPGVFNWVLDGLKRLLQQGDFTACPAIDDAINEFKRDSDSVNLFIDDGGYIPSDDSYESLKELYMLYKTFCNDFGYTSCSLRSFSERLRNYGFNVHRRAAGRIVYLKKQ